MKKLVAVLLTMVMLLAMGTTAFAEETAKGSITINEATNVSVENKTFNAYKVLDLKHYDAVSDTYVYTVPNELKSFYQEYFTDVKDEGDFSAQIVDAISQLKDQELFAFAQAVLAAAKKVNIAPSTATGSEGATSVTIEDLPLGYYVVEDAGEEKPISALILETTNPNVNVTIKADKPSIDKQIKENDKLVEKNNASIGDMVTYKITSQVPNMIGYDTYHFVVTDTMSKGLTFNNDATISIGGRMLTLNTDYTLTTATNEANETVIKIVFTDLIKEKTGDAIEITYSATVNEHAVVGTAGNPNKVNLEYSNNPNISSEIGKTPDEATYTYVTGIEITKIDQDNNRLQGAEFEITGEKVNHVLVKRDVYEVSPNGTYYKLKDGSYTKTEPTDDNRDQYENTTTKYELTTKTEVKKTQESIKVTGVVGDDGVLRFEGLAAGNYTITELKAPDGYNLLEKPISVAISWIAPVDSDTQCKWEATADKSTAVIEDGIVKLNVVNQAGAKLPSTGGIGTTIFYVVGTILMVASVVLLISKKRMGTQK